MKAVGIVCEYNPFHYGHLYMLEKCRESVGKDAAIICVMSGDFVQRGEAALFSKYARALAACRCGADAVLELPLPYCLSSAEGFAAAGVDIINAVGCTHIGFGSESGDIERLKSLAACIADEETLGRIRDELKQNAASSYAAARQSVAAAILGEDEARLLETPNNILAVEYLKAVYTKGYRLSPITVTRVGSSHDAAEDMSLLSASRLREMMLGGADISSCIPQAAWELFKTEKEGGRMRDDGLMETALLSRLRMLPPESFDALPDGGNGAGRRLYKAVREQCSVAEIAAAAQTRRYPLSRIRRMLMCAALGIDADMTKSPPPYTRILALSERGCKYIKEGAADFGLPVLTRAADIRGCGDFAGQLFAVGASAHDLYALQFVTNDDKKCGFDWRYSPKIV